MITSINPYTQEVLQTYTKNSKMEVEGMLLLAETTFKVWKFESVEHRVSLLKKFADLLETNKQSLAELITAEMGKPIGQSVAEIEKCVWLCDFYVVNSAQFLADELIETEASESFISYDPLGCILGIMPWNFPFWQVIRFAVPTLMAGNTVVLKHAQNVTGCALAIQSLFDEAGIPLGGFQTLVVDHEQIAKIIKHPTVKAVSLTGSEKAGRTVAAIAGKALKKTVLELGGNNACIIANDADLDRYLDVIVNARMGNAGQSCIAAKRFLVMDEIYDEFVKRLTEKVKALKVADPMKPDTAIGPLVSEQAAKRVYQFTLKSVLRGAQVVCGNSCKKAKFEPTILTNVKPGMPVFDSEVFGPIIAITRVHSWDEALTLANHSKYGLGTMIFTENIEKARTVIGRIDDGAFFINEMVKSDPRLPFGGTKASGYGRELSREGMLAFVNKKVVYVNSNATEH